MNHPSACTAKSLALAALLLSACSGGGGNTQDEHDDDELVAVAAGRDAGGQGGASGQAVDWGGSGGEEDPPPAFEPFDIALNQTVTVGAFVLEIEKAAVTPLRTQFDERATVELAFTATNASTELLAPLDNLWSEDLLLDIGGEFFFGEVHAQEVPGLRQGRGTLTWSLPAADLTPDQIREGVITLGGAGRNAVVIPLSDPAATVGFNDIPLEVAFVIQGHREATLEITSARIQFGRRHDNEPYEAGKALLVLVGGLGAVAHLENWFSENASLLRPDGISVAPLALNALATDQPRDIQMLFEVEQPISGTYEFVVVDEENGDSAVQSIVVP